MGKVAVVIAIPLHGFPFLLPADDTGTWPYMATYTVIVLLARITDRQESIFKSNKTDSKQLLGWACELAQRLQGQ